MRGVWAVLLLFLLVGSVAAQTAVLNVRPSFMDIFVRSSGGLVEVVVDALDYNSFEDIVNVTLRLDSGNRFEYRQFPDPHSIEVIDSFTADSSIFVPNRSYVERYIYNVDYLDKCAIRIHFFLYPYGGGAYLIIFDRSGEEAVAELMYLSTGAIVVSGPRPIHFPIILLSLLFAAGSMAVKYHKVSELSRARPVLRPELNRYFRNTLLAHLLASFLTAWTILSFAVLLFLNIPIFPGWFLSMTAAAVKNAIQALFLLMVTSIPVFLVEWRPWGRWRYPTMALMALWAGSLLYTVHQFGYQLTAQTIPFYALFAILLASLGLEFSAKDVRLAELRPFGSSYRKKFIK